MNEYHMTREERKRIKEKQKNREPLCDGYCDPRAHDGSGFCAKCIKYWVSDETFYKN